jgi:hypothetical protein
MIGEVIVNPEGVVRSNNTVGPQHTGNTVNTAKTISEMLRLFREGVAEYQPLGMERETGNPRVSLENLRSIKLPVWAIFVGPNSCLVTFVDGEQFLATGLSLEPGEPLDALIEYAAEKGYGSKARLADFYPSLPRTYTGPLPTTEERVAAFDGQWKPPAKQRPAGGPRS